MLLFSSCTTNLQEPTPSIKTVTTTEMLVPSFTPTPTCTSTLTVTPTHHPTHTQTPQPEWITRFSDPILNAIASREPDFLDDFDDKSGGWQRENWCGSQRMVYQNEELVLTSCGVNRVNLNYPDFVLKLDGRFLPDTKGDSWWGIYFRDNIGSGYSYSINYDGSVWLGGFGSDPSFSSAAYTGFETNNLMIIAKGSEFAFYVNGKPLYYINDNKFRWGDIWFRAWGGGSPNITDNPTIVGFDNFVIWDIQDVFVP